MLNKMFPKRKKMISGTIVLIVLMAFSTVFIAPAYSSSITGFAYSKEFTVNSAVGAGTDYQVKLIVHFGSGVDGGNVVYLNGNCRSDFGDVRFVGSDGSTFLSYWMENMYAGDYATFWVKISDDLSSSSSTNRIYYGNSGVSSASDGVATFILFDDFDGTSLNSALWETYGAINNPVGYAFLDVSDGWIHIWGPHGQPSGILSTTKFLYNVRVHALAFTNNAPGEGMVGFQDGLINQNHAFVGSLRNFASVYFSSNRLSGISSNVGMPISGSPIYLDSNFHIFDEVMLDGSHTFSFVDGILIVNNGKVPTEPLSASLTIWDDGDVLADYFALTKYVDPEPQVNFPQFTITPSAGAGGSISPNTPQTVNYGATPSFTVTASDNYHVLDIKVDGVSILSQLVSGVYTFPAVTASHTIDATFAINTFTIDVSAGVGGSISPNTKTVNYGGSQTFTVTADIGYYITDVVVDGVSKGAVSSWDFDNVQASHTITATFTQTGYSLTVNSVGSGSVVKSPNQLSYHYGDVVQLTATSIAGWSFGYWSDALTGSANPASLTVTGDMSVIATFTPNSYTVSFTENGLPPGTQWNANLGGTTLSSRTDTIIFNVLSGTYSWSVTNPIGGGSHVRYITTISSGTISVTGQTSIPVTYATQYQVSFTAAPSKTGTTNPSGTNVWITAGSKQISATANSGYVFDQWTTSTSSITIDNAKSDTATATINGPGVVTANFGSVLPPTYTVTFRESNLPLGTTWSVTLNGFTHTSTTDTITFDIAAGTYSWSGSNPVPGSTGTRYVTSTSSGRMTVEGATTIQIQYRPQYFLTMQVEPTAAGSTSPKNGWYDAGTTVAISASAKNGHSFINWTGIGTGSYSGTSARSSVIMNGPITETAKFT